MIEIDLTRGYKTIIDDVDADLANYNWHTLTTGSRHVYATRVQDKKRILLHRVILARKLGKPLPRKMKADHINRNGLDNRRDNLRLATHGQNMANSKRKSNATSAYRGVRQRKSNGKWRAQISVGGKNLHIGYYDTAEEAALAWNQAARKLRGEYAQLNAIDYGQLAPF